LTAFNAAPSSAKICLLFGRLAAQQLLLDASVKPAAP
jgi:hypothetical protein